MLKREYQLKISSARVNVPNQDAIVNWFSSTYSVRPDFRLHGPAMKVEDPADRPHDIIAHCAFFF